MHRSGKRFQAPAIVGMLAVLLLLLGPALYSVLLSLKSYAAFQGVWLSPWVGFANFQKFLDSAMRTELIENSLLLGATGFACACLPGLLMALFLPRIRSHASRGVAMGLMLLPAFVPSVCWTLCILAKSGDGSGGSFLVYYLLSRMLAGAGVIGIAGAAYEIASPGRGFLRGIGWAMLLNAFLLLTPDMEILSMLPSRLSYPVLDTFAFQESIIRTNVSYGAAVYLLKSGMQLLPGAVVCIGSYFLFVRGKKPPLDSVSRGGGEAHFSVWLAIVLPLMTLGIALLAPPLSAGGGLGETFSAIEQLMLAALAGAIAFVIGFLLINGLKRCGFLLFAFIAGLLLVTSNLSAQLSALGMLGLEGTQYPAVCTALLSPTGLVIVLLCARIAQTQSMRNRPVRLLSLLPACYAAARFWGDALTQSTYLSEAYPQPPGLTLYRAIQQQALPATFSAFLWTLLPPLIFGALGCWALSVFLDRSRVAQYTLAPEDHQATQHIVEDDHHDVVEEVAEVLVEPEGTDDNPHEADGEKQHDGA